MTTIATALTKCENLNKEINELLSINTQKSNWRIIPKLGSKVIFVSNVKDNKLYIFDNFLTDYSKFHKDFIENPERITSPAKVLLEILSANDGVLKNLLQELTVALDELIKATRKTIWEEEDGYKSFEFIMSQSLSPEEEAKLFKLCQNAMLEEQLHKPHLSHADKQWHKLYNRVLSTDPTYTILIDKPAKSLSIKVSNNEASTEPATLVTVGFKEMESYLDSEHTGKIHTYLKAWLRWSCDEGITTLSLINSLKGDLEIIENSFSTAIKEAALFSYKQKNNERHTVAVMAAHLHPLLTSLNSKEWYEENSEQILKLLGKFVKDTQFPLLEDGVSKLLEKLLGKIAKMYLETSDDDTVLLATKRLASTLKHDSEPLTPTQLVEILKQYIKE